MTLEDKSTVVGVTGEGGSDDHAHNFTVEVDDETGEVTPALTSAGGIDGHTHTISGEGQTGETNDHTHSVDFGDKSGHLDDEEDEDNAAHPEDDKKPKELEIAVLEFKVAPNKIRETKTAEGEFGFFEGFASTFGNIDLTDDIIKEGAFSKTLQSGRRIKLLWQHSFFEVIGSVVEASENAAGLFIKGRINLGTEKGREALALLKAGDLDSMSIGFRTVKSEFDSDTFIRTLIEIELFEVSIVTEPANPRAVITSVKAIQLLDKANSLSDIEDVLKSKGFSGKERRVLIGKIKSFQTQCDVEEEKANKEPQCDVDGELVEVLDGIKHLINHYKGD